MKKAYLSQFFCYKQTISGLRLTYEHWSWILVKFLLVLLWGFHVVIGSIGEFTCLISEYEGLIGEFGLPISEFQFPISEL